MGDIQDTAPTGDIAELWRGYGKAGLREYDAAQRRDERQFPHYSEADGWRTRDVEDRSSHSDHGYEHGNWTAGFWHGVMWLTSLASGDPGPRELASRRTGLLGARATDTTTHDLGFLFYPSIVLGRRLDVLPDQAANDAHTAARTLAQRFMEPAQLLQAFGPIADHRTAGTSTIDTMMNLPLLWWSAGAGGDTRLHDVARRHARTSARLFFRPDGSTYHLLHVNPVSGALLRRGTFQGDSDDSCWSRGQAWAGCGFAWAYAATGEPELRDAAVRALEWFCAQAPKSEPVPWDFTDTDPSSPRDASAGAVAALGCLLLGRVLDDEQRRATWSGRGRQLLLANTTGALLDREGILGRSSYSVPHGQGLDGAVAWGDFYYGLALALAVDAIPLATLLGFDHAGTTS